MAAARGARDACRTRGTAPEGRREAWARASIAAMTIERPKA
ncbi:MAG: hypothetical protein JWN27_2715 [Candidatus Eremiobacteraeota bacterium]|nr:hypothetical protein [Candidatus Eremiobacteraeota bacterium]